MLLSSSLSSPSIFFSGVFYCELMLNNSLSITCLSFAGPFAGAVEGESIGNRWGASGCGGRDKKNEGMARVWHPQAKEMQQGRNERTCERTSERTTKRTNEAGRKDPLVCNRISEDKKKHRGRLHRVLALRCYATTIAVATTACCQVCGFTPYAIALFCLGWVGLVRWVIPMERGRGRKDGP